MHRLTLVTVLLAAALTATTGAGASRATKPNLFGTRGSIERLAADGASVAATTTGIKKQCDRVVVWNRAKRSFRAFKTGINCPGYETSGGQELRDVALAGTRVAWFEEGAGNLQDLSIETAATTGPRISDVAFAENQSGAEGGTDGDYLGNLFGDGKLIAYNTWSVCTILPPGYEDDLAQLCKGPQPAVTDETHVPTAQRLWKLVLGHKSRIAAGTATLPVVAVDANRIATRQKNGITLYSATGSVLKKLAVPAGTLSGTALQGGQLATLRNGRIEVYDVKSGAEMTSIPVGRGAVLRDLENGLAVWVRGHRIHVVRVSDGKGLTFFPPGTGPVDAQLEAPGLFYSYSMPKRSAKGRIVFVPSAQLSKQLR